MRERAVLHRADRWNSAEAEGGEVAVRTPGSDLEFVAHLVGDIHQPLHDTTDQDRGGNCLYIKFVLDNEDESPKTKFHYAWDRAIIEDRLGTNDVAIAKHLLSERKSEIAAAKSAATTALTDVSGAVRAWIDEAHALAVMQLYEMLKPDVPKLETAPVASDCHGAAPVFKNAVWMIDQSPTDQAFDLIESQLVKAGARLAALVECDCAVNPTGQGQGWAVFLPTSRCGGELLAVIDQAIRH